MTTSTQWAGPKPSLAAGLMRGAIARCPRCGSRGLFNKTMTMVDDCPGCGMHFERSQGYWLGAMVINLTVTIGVFLAVFIGGMVLTWPDVPWNGLLIVLIVLMLAVPALVHPVARTVWVALERHIRSKSEPYE